MRITHEQIDNMYNWLLISYAFLLPFFDLSIIKFNSLIIIILSVIWLLRTLLHGSFKSTLATKELWLLISLFMVQSISIFHGGDKNIIMLNFQIKLPLLILPLVVLSHNILSDRLISNINIAFVLGLLFSIFVTFRFIFEPICSNVNFWDFSHYEDFLLLHRPYYGLYLAYASYFILTDKSENYIALKSKIVKIFLPLIFLLFAWHIQAKMALIAFLILTPVYFASYYKKLDSKRVLIAFSCVLLVLVTLSVFYIRNKNNLEHIGSKSRFYILSINTRLIHYDCGYEIVKKHPIFGAGVGQLNVLLDKCYDENNALFTKMNQKMNIHNEFLEEFARHGIIGLLVYCGVFYFLLKFSIANNSTIYILFLLLFIFCSLTESTLYRAQGVLFFSFFNTLYLKHFLDRKKI